MWLKIILCLVVGLFLSVKFYHQRYYKGAASDHFNGKTFVNAVGPVNHGFSAFLKWRLTSASRPWPEWVDSDYAPLPPARVEGEGLRITFINHASLLIQTAGVNIITDPIWSLRAGPLSWLGAKRVRNPGIRFEDLPKIDVVLISHDHYDHLDIPTIRRLVARDNPQILFGLGMLESMRTHPEFRQAQSLDWWQDIAINPNVNITFVPAQHFSRRTLWDSNATLWGGFVISTPKGPVYFAGDTGYSQHFKEIYAKFGSITVALLPIGAYAPEWFMHPMHITPAEALQAARDLHAKHMISIHFGTFKLADDGYEEPVIALQAALEQTPLTEGNVIVPEFGESLEF